MIESLSARKRPACVERAYKKHRAEAPDWWQPFSQREMNSFAYRLMEDGRTADALNAFELNAVLFPSSWNVWDSFGEGLLEAGELDRAEASYRKSLVLNSGNSNASAMLETIEQRRGG